MKSHLPVNACLAPVCSMHGLAVTTIEGIGSTKTKLHPVQERLAKAHGSQCGFCTPGIIMSMYTLLRTSPRPTLKEMEVAFQGNLCRCTGYRPIIEGYKTFTEEWEIAQRTQQVNGINGNGCANGGCPMGEQCCKVQNGNVNGNYKKTKENEEVLFKPSEFTPYHPSQEPIFPPELKISDKYDTEYLIIEGPDVTWYRPTTLNDLLQLKSKFPNAKIVVGNTEVGVEIKFKHMSYPVIIQPVQISEMTEVEASEEGVSVGASTTLMDMEHFLRKQMLHIPEQKARIFKAIVEMLNWFAGKQIRSVGAIGSNIMTGSPISDMLPVLMATKVVLDVQSFENGIRKVILDGNFFTGYRKTIVKPEEILRTIHIPYSTEDQHFVAYKQARRREDDIAIVNAAVNVTFKTRTHFIDKISLAFGGMSFKTTTAPKTEERLMGLPWNSDTLETAYSYLLEDLPLDPGAPGGMILYRRSLTLSLFFKAFLAISQRLREYIPDIVLNPRDLSGSEVFHGKELKSAQYFTIVPETQSKGDPLQRPIIHASAYKQVCGEAIYCDDIPHFENEAYMGLVLSTKAHANILSIDPSKALAMKGVHAFFSAKDLKPEHNCFGPVLHDEKVFYSDKVTSQGQVVAVVIAEDQTLAQKAARAVKVEYEELEPVIVSMEDAIERESIHTSYKRKVVKGDVDKVMWEAPHVLEGRCRMGGQEHFYLETQAVLAVPKKEDDEMDIYASTQHPTEVSKLIAEVLGVQQNKVIGKVKRLGGGFGGKESKACLIAIPAAVAASKLNRPIRCMLDRDEDIIMTGGRHPFLMKYKVAFDNDGKILGCDIVLYNNCGYSADLSFAVMDRAVTHFENAYYIPVARVVGWCLKTNLPSNTAFRGFGGPQGMYAAECIIRDIADYLNKDVVHLSELNLYKEGDITYYNQKLVNCTIGKCWREVMESSNYYQRRKIADEFNRKNRYKKRGMSVVPTKYGIAFTIPFLNQGGALILVYTDGSVLLSHGGIEMGQGLYTKTIQVACRVLEISPDKIHISETATDKVPNTSPTAASSGSDINGMAVMNACQVIKDRLKPYREANPDGSWEDWVKAAYINRVSLSATGFYKTPDIGYDWEKNTGMMFSYYTYGAAVTEVEIDTLTGDHQVLRSDIVMDLGESINPAIDVGQIEGAFIQGYGLFVMEELMYSPTGATFTRGPGTYKIPGFADIPCEFNVSLLKGVSNPRAVFSSKAVGEPPLFLASSVLYAIKDAIKEARKEYGIIGHFDLDAPATSAKIRMACQDHITSKLKVPEPGSFKPWNVSA